MREEYREQVSSQLVNKQRILIVMSLIFLVISIWHLVQDSHEWRWALAGIALGIIIGLIMTMFDQYVWNEDEGQVVTSSNIFATVMLVLYIIFMLTKDNILDDWITQPAALTMATSWLSLAALLTRIRRLRRELFEVMKIQG